MYQIVFAKVQMSFVILCIILKQLHHTFFSKNVKQSVNFEMLHTKENMYTLLELFLPTEYFHRGWNWLVDSHLQNAR